ncbi:MAG: hypothetical protein GEU81_01210 [Nitriliruptorales bacterium]|nr:hypothetical protein [Nitriliruptorales bacterium]
MDEMAGGFDPHLLFAGRDRLGWEAAELGPVQPGSLAEEEPVWHEPPAPDELAYAYALHQARASGPPGPLVAGIVVALFVAGLILLGQSWWGPLLSVGTFGAIYPLLRAVGARERQLRREWEESEQTYEQRRTRLWAEHLRRVDEWRRQVELQEESELHRLAQAPLWYPLPAQPIGARIDVVGGGGVGWNSLLATFGCSRLSQDAALLVLDFSEYGVADDLAALAGQVGKAVAGIRLPDELDRIDLLAGLGGDDVVTLFTDAIHAGRARGDDGPDDRAADADLLRTVAGCLQGPASVTRLAAGIRTLLGESDQQGVLAPAEVDRLVEEIERAAGTERARERLRLLRISLDLLGGAAPANPATAARLRPAEGVLVVETGGHDSARKELLDRVVVQALLHGLRNAPAANWRQTVAVAGADRLGDGALERLARQAERSQVQLLVMFHHLRDIAERFLGAGAGATVVMRLGNGREAATAAEFIGRGHRFELSDLTMQLGQTFTDARGTSAGGSEASATSEANERSRTTGSGWVPDRRATTSVVVTSSRSADWSQSVNQAWAESRQGGQTRSRVYEFHVEPTVLQTLPETAFALLGVGGGRRVVFGDCNPAIASFPRVSRHAAEG